MNPSTQVGPWDAAAILFIVLVAFLIFREVVCWYWKVNEGVALLREIRDSLQKITGKPETSFQRFLNDVDAEE